MELNVALKSCKSGAPGEDGIHYDIIKKLPESSKQIILDMYNKSWDKGIIPESWAEATIIPLIKPNKPAKDPSSYRPISLTSTFTKLMQKMIKHRLCNHLEKHNIFSENQSGCRADHSCDDNLIRLESEVKTAQSKRKYVTAIFLDLTAAFDTMWAEGAIATLIKYNIRGRMLKWLSEFLRVRKIKVKFGGATSTTHTTENGCPQGSVLSPILFSLFMNTLNETTLKHNTRNKYTKAHDKIKISQFVDDSALWVTSNSPKQGIKKLQKILPDVEKWALNFGFKINPLKTQTIVFRHKETVLNDGNLPKLTLCNNTLEYKENITFLGLIFDKTLTWQNHINSVIGRCEKDLNVIRSIKGKNWGSSKKCLATIYKALIKSKIQYGLVAYGSANKTYLDKLQVMQNRAIKSILGVPNYARTEAILAEMGEHNIYDQIDIVSLKYWARSTRLGQRLSANREIYNRLGKWLKRIRKPYTVRITDLINELNLSSDQLTPPTYANLIGLEPISIDTSLTTLFKKGDNQSIIKNITNKFINSATAPIKIYTDGSKDQEKNITGAGVSVFHNNKEIKQCKIKLDGRHSIFTCELFAIKTAITWIHSCKLKDQTIDIYTDSLSSLQALEAINNKNRQELIIDIYRTNSIIKKLYNTQINLKWIPSHVGVTGNEAADKLAKEASISGTPTRLGLSVQETYSYINNYYKNKAEIRFQEYKATKNFVYDNRNTSLKIHHHIPKYDKIYTRLRVGASYLGSENKVRPRQCPHCNENETFEHIIFHCKQHSRARSKLEYKLLISLKLTNINRLTLLFPPNHLEEKIKDALFTYLEDINYLQSI